MAGSTYIENLIRLQELHRIIERGKTGNADAISKKLNISRAVFYFRLDDLKALGAEIQYDRIQKSFYYINDFKMEIKITYNS